METYLLDAAKLFCNHNLPVAEYLEMVNAGSARASDEVIVSSKKQMEL